jgi:hypothetical protein
VPKKTMMPVMPGMMVVTGSDGVMKITQPVLPGPGHSRLLPAWAALLAALAAGTATSQQPRWVPAQDGQETFAVVDALLMQRDNAANPAPLVIDNDTQATAIAGTTPQFPVAGGVRAVFGQHAPDRVGWEVGYTGVYGMSADASTSGAGNLQVPTPLAGDVTTLRNASQATVTYGSVLNSAEANLLCTERFWHGARRSAYEAERQSCTATVDWLAGFRWAGLDERSGIGLTDPTADTLGTYSVRSSSNLFGGQIGLRGRAQWQAWALEGWLKAALAGAALSQSQDPIVDSVSGLVQRTGRGSQTGTVGGVFDLGGTLVYRIDDTWGLRFGYSMLWLTGVALAPDQFDFSNNLNAGTAVDGNATLWLGGGTLGLEARW